MSSFDSVCWGAETKQTKHEETTLKRGLEGLLEDPTETFLIKKKSEMCLLFILSSFRKKRAEQISAYYCF